ncbi:tyrosine-protein kinase STYK1b [Clupea harengus]|uniref:Tyrosine-protein kinase STYK1b n=1 Tax=Clupea harengus TaxID=7950 RepID=A0A6P3VYZ1_CLUHA|nr:tyrosine-protein kinase STYK1b [Clupea harengus]XP_042565003.1 tyrosine-protein kinase STYK1b [Clupea harengus]
MSDSLCQTGDTLCYVRVYEQEVIVVPVLLLASFLGTLILILLLRFCPEKVDRLRAKTVINGQSTQRSRRNLQGIDAPFNAMEHESIALDLPSYSTFNPPPSSSGVSSIYSSGRGSFSADNDSFKTPPYGGVVHSPSSVSVSISTAAKEPRQRLPEKFKLVTPLPSSYSLKSDGSVSLYRARMDNRNAVLRVLKDSASASERQSFLGFASFLSQLGPHPFLPELLGVVSLRAPLITVIEEMENKDMLGFLWKCRQDNVGLDAICEMTEKRIFTMATQVASALEYLHSKDLIHGNVKARSVLVSHQFTAKLWGLGGVYARGAGTANVHEDSGKKKWHAPELLARRPISQKSDVWSFGLMLYEMASLGEAPFAEVPVTELLQYHQRGKTIKKPPNCSNALYSVIKACCQWKEQDRVTLAEVSRKLQSGEKSANDKTVLRVPEPINIERYLQEAGYGDSNSYTVF